MGRTLPETGSFSQSPTSFTLAPAVNFALAGSKWSELRHETWALLPSGANRNVTCFSPGSLLAGFGGELMMPETVLCMMAADYQPSAFVQVRNGTGIRQAANLMQ